METGDLRIGRTESALELMAMGSQVFGLISTQDRKRIVAANYFGPDFVIYKVDFENSIPKLVVEGAVNQPLWDSIIAVHAR